MLTYPPMERLTCMFLQLETFIHVNREIIESIKLFKSAMTRVLFSITPLHRSICVTKLHPIHKCWGLCRIIKSLIFSQVNSAHFYFMCPNFTLCVPFSLYVFHLILCVLLKWHFRGKIWHMLVLIPYVEKTTSDSCSANLNTLKNVFFR